MQESFFPTSYLLKEGTIGYRKIKRFVFEIPELKFIRDVVKSLDPKLEDLFYYILIIGVSCGNNVTSIKSELLTIFDDSNLDLEDHKFHYLIRNCNYIFSIVEYYLFTLARQLNVSVEYHLDTMVWTPEKFIGIEDFIDDKIIFVVMEKEYER